MVKELSINGIQQTLHLTGKAIFKFLLRKIIIED